MRIDEDFFLAFWIIATLVLVAPYIIIQVVNHIKHLMERVDNNE